MITYVVYIILGSYAVVSFGNPYVMVAWFGMIALDWSVSVYNKKTKEFKCAYCGKTDGVKWVKKEKK